MPRAKKNNHLEEDLQISVCRYVKSQYPKVLFNSDLSGIRLTMNQAIRVKKMRSSKGFPDLMIFQPNKYYHGLFIELKKEGEKLYKKDGITPISEHVKEQIDMIRRLKLLGYFAIFCIGFDEAINVIDDYMSLPS